MEVEMLGKPIRCNFGARASDEVSETGQKATDRYSNLVTEMWARVARLGRNGQLRGMNAIAASQFCGRRFKRGTTPLALESKKDYKARNQGKSPDEGDALVLACHAAMVRAGLNATGVRDVGPYSAIPTFATNKNISSSYTNSVDFSRLKSYRLNM
jgi:hypothetical protein